MLPPRLAARPTEIPAGCWALAYADSFAPPSWYLLPEGESVASALKGTVAGKSDALYRCFVGWGRDLSMKQHDTLEVWPEAGEIAYVKLVPRADWTTAIIILVVIALAASITNLILALTAKQDERDTQNRFDSPTLRGTRNRIAIHEPIPKVYGRYRTKPPLGAYTYTEIVGADHYLRCLFVVGYGPLVMDIADMKIGETPITEFNEVEIEVRPGELDDPPITLYPTQVTQEDLNITISDQKMALEDAVPGEPLGGTGWQTRNTDLSTDEIGVEFLLPSGIGNITGKGQNQPTSVVHMIEFRKVGDTVWMRPPVATMRVTALASKRSDGEVMLNQVFRLGSFQIGVNFPTPERAQYEVRVRNTESAGIDVEGHNTFFHETRWIAIKSFRNEAPWTKKGIAMVAMRIKASDQLQGTVDDFSLVARSKLPTWNGTEWTAPIETRNPAWIYADILRGQANPAPVADEFVDANRLLEWATICETHTTPDENGVPVLNPMYYDAVIDYRTTVYRMLTEVSAVARATPHMRDGVYSVVIDKDRSGDPPAQMITPANIIAGSFGSRKMFIEEAHGYRIAFHNEAKDWGEDEVIVFTPGYDAASARIYEKIEWTGITNPDRAVDETRFMVFERRYRPEIYRFDMDIENLIVERGDVVLFSHDVPMLGLAYGRIAELFGTETVNVTGFRFDEKVVFEPGVNYGVRIRRHQSVFDVLDSVPVVNPATTEEVETNLLTLVTPLTVPNLPEVGDLVSFGELGIETRRCIVRSISPQQDLVATIELHDEAAQIFADLTQPIPPYDPGINRPRDLPPLAPEIISVEAPDHLNLIVTFRLRSGFGRPIARSELQVRVSPDGIWQDVPSVPPGGMVVAVIPGLTLDVFYDVRVRAVSSSGLFSPWTQWPEPFLHSSHAIDISRYSIADLRLENILSDPTQFVGPSPQFRWQLQVIDGTDLGDPVSDAPRQASIVRESEIDRFDGYLVRILEAVWNADLNDYVPGAMIDEDLIHDHRYVYSFDHNVDDGGPRREIFFEVAAQIDGLLTESALQLATNPSPLVPEIVSISGASGTRVEIVLAVSSSDADWEGFLVWMSDTSGFIPGDANLIFKGRMEKHLVVPAFPGSTVYVRFASYDKFSANPTTLNVSPEHAVTVNPIPNTVYQISDAFAQYDEQIMIRVPSTATPPSWVDAFGMPVGFSPVAYERFYPPIQFDATSDGNLSILWHGFYGADFHTSGGAPFRMYIGFQVTPTGNAYPGTTTGLFLAKQTFQEPAQGGGSLAAATIGRVETSIPVLAGNTYWIDFWFVGPHPPFAYNFYTWMDIITLEEVIGVGE